MKKLSLPVKISLLMTLALLLISAAGYLSYRSLSSIVASIQVKSRPDLRPLIIREISNDLEKAENSVRLYTYTRKQKDIEPYYVTIELIDDKINRLLAASKNDTVLLYQIDTISGLIEEDILIWNKMLDLYHNDSLDNYIRKLTAKLAVGTLSNKNADKSILRRVFSKRNENKLDQEEIIRDLNRIEEQNSIQNTKLLANESRLAETDNEIKERFYILISRMEDEVINSINKNAEAANKLAMKTYLWLAMFTLSGTLLVILVLIIVVRFIRKTHEYQLALIKSKEETEKLAKTKEMFIANMSHEIRTPVNAIYGFAEQLLYRSFDEKNRKIIDIIRSSSDHLVKIVNSILDFSKLENDKIILENIHFQIHTVCEEVQLLFEKKALENNTRLQHSIGKSVPIVLFGDSYRLKQILINLVDNAVKFTSDGEIHFSADSKNKQDNTIDLMLKVSDTGIGISEDMRERIFDDFTQADTDITRKYGGTGLGLSIVKKLVELLQGTISLKSEKNKGTTVTCFIPYTIGKWEKLPELIQALEIPESIKGLKVLIVDDEEYNRLLFKTIFDRWSVIYDEAEDGLKAIKMIKKNHYDLVFMDVRMPGQNGLKSTEYIRDTMKKNQEELPIIGISATHSHDDIQQYRLSGMNTFIPKPFTEKILLEIILSLRRSADGKPVMAESTAQKESSSSSSRVDLNNLYHVANHDIPFVKQMLTRFIESTEQGLNEIHQAIITSHPEAAMENAHKIAAPCRHIGAHELYLILKSIEKQARNKNMDLLVKLYEDLNKEFLEIKQILHEHLAKTTE
jgi:signal transduction histidine kinase/CheY-like chemotaxis protein/HPt (histidine-containing phosphotransfer) domain-containing protein